MKFGQIFLVLLTQFTIALASVESHSENVNKEERVRSDVTASKASHETSEQKFYERLLKAKRVEQASAIKSLKAVKDFKKQKTTVKTLLDNIKKVLSEGKIALEFTKIETLHEVFRDETLREQVSRVLENTAFLGDFALFFPDLVEKVFENDAVFRSIYEWSYTFSNRLSVYDPATMEMLDLAGQELGIIPKKDNFTNPYRADVQKEELIRAAMEQMKRAKEEKKAATTLDVKQKRSKGPKLSHNEL